MSALTPNNIRAFNDVLLCLFIAVRSRGIFIFSARRWPLERAPGLTPIFDSTRICARKPTQIHLTLQILERERLENLSWKLNLQPFFQLFLFVCLSGFWRFQDSGNFRRYISPSVSPSVLPIVAAAIELPMVTVVRNSGSYYGDEWRWRKNASFNFFFNFFLTLVWLSKCSFVYFGSLSQNSDYHNSDYHNHWRCVDGDGVVEFWLKVAIVNIQSSDL